MPNALSTVEISSSASGYRKSSGPTSSSGAVNVSSSAIGGSSIRLSVMRQVIDVLGKNVGIATHSWWEHEYIYRRRINIQSPRGEDVSKGHPVVVDLPLSMLTGGKVRKDLEDIELIYAVGGELFHLYREARITDDAVQVAFELYDEIEENTLVENQYYIYYGNLELENAPRRPSRDFEWVLSSYLPPDLELPTEPLDGAPESFSDVSEEHLFYTEIMWMLDIGITNGFSDGTFRPTDEVPRQIAAVFLYRLFGSPEGPFPDPGFSDVPNDHLFATEIAWLYDREITNGFADGTFRPTEPLTRMAAAAFFHRLVGEPEPSTYSRFVDVRPGHRFYDAIIWASEEGITQGFTDRTFRPENPTTRQAMAFFLFRFIHRLIGLFPTDDATSVFNRSEWPAKTEYKSDTISYTRPGEHWLEGHSNVRHARATAMLYAEHFRILSEVGPDKAIMETQTDGSHWEEVDLFSLTEEIVPVYDSYYLSPDVHEIRVRVSGKSIEYSLGDSVNIRSLEYFKPVHGFDVGEDVAGLFWKASLGGS